MRAVASREVYRNQWMSVREDSIVHGDGSPGVYGVVDKPDFAVIIPLQDPGFWLVEQFRYPIGRRAWEFPQGSWSDGAGGSSASLAATELLEETGLRAGELRHLGHAFGAYGFCSQGFDVYLARDLVAGPPQREATEQDMQQRLVSVDEFRQLVRDGAIVDAVTIAAYTLLQFDQP